MIISNKEKSEIGKQHLSVNSITVNTAEKTHSIVKLSWEN